MDWAILLVAGFAAGFVSGLFGVGGGIIMTPVLHYLLGHTWGEAVALSLFVMMVQAPIGLWRHHGKGVVEMRVGLPLVIAGAAGVALGHWLLPQIDVPWLKLAFAGVMAFAAYRMIVQRDRAAHDDGTKRPGVLALLALGFGAGVISRLLGIGGGVVIVPVLVFMGVPAHVAVGSSLIPVFSNAYFASMVNLAQGLDWILALPLVIGAVIGAPTGVWAAHAMDEGPLRRLIGGALVIVSGLVAATSGAF